MSDAPNWRALRASCPRLLALDAAVKTGWATLIDGEIASGVFDMSNYPDMGAQGWAFENWICDKMSEIDHVILERVHVSPKTAKNGYRLCGLSFVANAIASSRDVERTEVTPSQWRKEIHGKGNLRTADAKKAALAWCAAHGFEVADDNEAEAICILHYKMLDYKAEMYLGAG